MANYKLTTHSTTGTTSELAFTATATNTVVNSITATDKAASATVNIYVKKAAGTAIQVGTASLSAANTPEEMLARPLALQATDAIYVDSSRTGTDFVVSYVEESDVAQDTALGGLADVDTAGVANGDALVYNSTSGNWEPGTVSGGGGASVISDLTDVNTTAPTDGSFLRWDSGQSRWIDETVTGTDLDWSDTSGATIETKFDAVDVNLTSLNQAVKQQGGFTTIYKDVNDKTKGYMEVGDTSAVLGKNNTRLNISENSPGIVDIKVQDDGTTPASITAMRVTNATGVANTPQVVVAGTTPYDSSTTLTVEGDSYLNGDVTLTGTLSGLRLLDCDDVNASGATSGDYLYYTGANWRARTLSSFKTISVSGQSDVVADSDMDTLTFVAGTNVTLTTDASGDSITIAASGGGASAIDDLTDVTLLSPSAGEILKYDGAEWGNDNLVVSELGNVVLTSVADGDVLTYDSSTSKWVNEAPSGGGGGGGSHPYCLFNLGARHQHSTSANGNAQLTHGASLGLTYNTWATNFGSSAAIGALGTVGTTTIAGNQYLAAYGAKRCPKGGTVSIHGLWEGDSSVTSGTWYIHVWKVDSTTVSNWATGTYTATTTGTLVASSSVTNPTSSPNIKGCSFVSTNGGTVSAGDYLFVTVEHTETVTSTQYYVANFNVDIT